jgi:PTH1 family peptidyl-tRNA hydrolase
MPPRRFFGRRETAPLDKPQGLRLSPTFGARQGDPDEREDEGSSLKSPVVVGLGNPGRRYERTRHNVGYLVADELARRHGGSWRSKKKAEAAEVGFGLKNVSLLKPTTFMNNSGSALGGMRVGDMIVVHDELDLPVGTVRVKVGGGAGGHNGLRSIINQLGPDFIRVRVGIGRPPEGVSVTDYVLSRMDRAVADAVPVAADAVEAVLEHGPERAMNRFNTRV